MRICAHCSNMSCPECQSFLDEKHGAKKEEPIPLKVGQKVLWKFGGGPAMVVIAMQGNEYVCAWWTKHNHFFTQSFPRHYLTLYDDGDEQRIRMRIDQDFKALNWE